MSTAALLAAPARLASRLAAGGNRCGGLGCIVLVVGKSTVSAKSSKQSCPRQCEVWLVKPTTRKSSDVKRLTVGICCSWWIAWVMRDKEHNTEMNRQNGATLNCLQAGKREREGPVHGADVSTMVDSCSRRLCFVLCSPLHAFFTSRATHLCMLIALVQ